MALRCILTVTPFDKIYTSFSFKFSLFFEYLVDKTYYNDYLFIKQVMTRKISDEILSYYIQFVELKF